jgi:hypothetical protein
MFDFRTLKLDEFVIISFNGVRDLHKANGIPYSHFLFCLKAIRQRRKAATTAQYTEDDTAKFAMLWLAILISSGRVQHLMDEKD